MKKPINRLRELREESGYTQEEFGHRFYLGKPAVSRYETGSRNIPNNLLVDFAEFFDTSVDYILGRNVPKDSPLIKPKDKE